MRTRGLGNVIVCALASAITVTMSGCGVADRPPCLVLKADGSCSDKWPVIPPEASASTESPNGVGAPKLTVQNIGRRRAPLARSIASATLGDYVYFAGDDGTHGVELLRTDGERIELVKDLSPGTDDTTIERIFAANGVVYFVVANRGVREVWRTDGTDAGTKFLYMAGPRPAGSSPTTELAFAATDNRVFFVSQSTNFDQAIMSTDGNRVDVFYEPTHLIEGMVAVAGVLYVRIGDGIDAELVRTDGTPEGTLVLKKFSDRGLGEGQLVAAGSSVYFLLGDAFDDEGKPVSTLELWRTDGTVAGTIPIAPTVTSPLRPEPGTDLTVRGSTLFLLARAKPTDDPQLCKSDGESVQLAPIAKSERASRIARTDRAVFFSSSDEKGIGLYATDGTKSTRVAARASRILGSHADKLYFLHDDGRTGAEPWLTDGTVEGTHALADVRKGAVAGVAVGLGAAKSGYIFVADDDVGDGQLWKSDGTPLGTKAIPSPNANTIGSSPHGIAVLPSGKAVFFANDREGGMRAWVSDGTETGTKPLSPQGPLDSPTWFDDGVAIAKGEAWFVAPLQNGARVEQRLYRSGGSPDRTSSIALPDFAFGGRAVAVNDKVYVVDDANRVSYIDGTSVVSLNVRTAGGVLVNDGKRVIAMSADVPMLVVVDGPHTNMILPESDAPYSAAITGALPLATRTIFSVERRGQDQAAIYATDGTPGGTVSLVTRRGAAASMVAPLGGVVLAAAGGALWATDGTREGTANIKSRITVHASGDRTDVRGVTLRGVAYFSATVAGEPSGIYRSDGTPEGTTLVASFQGAEGPALPPSNLVVFRDRIWFAASTDAGGRELYSSDGTEAGTRREHDIAPGARSSFPSSLVVGRDTLWFAASDYKSGRELYRLK